MIHLEEVNPGNWRLGLRVAEAQRRYVADSAGILARAWAYREERSRAYIIYEDNTPVGMALYYDCGEFDAYDLSQLFIDERYQGRGLGTRAARMIVDEMRRDGKYEKAVLCYIEGNEAARRMYERIGFRLTGEADGNEVIMEMGLR